MKRNKQIDEKTNRVVVLGIATLIVGVILISILCYKSYHSGDSIQTIILFGGILGILFFFKTIERIIEKKVMNRMMNSSEYNHFINSYGFNKINTGSYKGAINNYFVTLNNYEDKNFTFVEIENKLYIDVFCDCSNLTQKEINRIEDKGYVVTHHSIRKVLSSWWNRFKTSKLENCIDEQLDIAIEYKLNNIEEKELKKDEYWA